MPENSNNTVSTLPRSDKNRWWSHNTITNRTKNHSRYNTVEERMSADPHVIHRTCHLSRSTNNIGLVHTAQHSSTYQEANMVSFTSKRQEIDAKPCAVCLRKAKFRCSSCKTVFYCGRAHQMLDWKDHRFVLLFNLICLHICRKTREWKSGNEI